MKKLRPWEPVVVEWIDAAECRAEDQVKRPVRAVRVGFFVKEDHDPLVGRYIVLASERFEDGSWRDGIAIRKCDIVRIIR